jgi:hypothetical protein
MSDLLDFEKNLTEIEEELKSECEDSYIIESTFVAIRDMIEVLIIKRDQRIKELESKLKPSPKVSPVEKQNEPTDKPKKECPPGKILNPKTGRCINKPKEKTQKRRGRPKKNVEKPKESEEKPKKECPPGKILNPKTGRCINKPKEKTQKRRGRPKKSEPKEDYSWIGEDSDDEEDDNINPEVLKKLKLFKKETPKKYKVLKKDIQKQFGLTLHFDEMDKLYIYKNGEEEVLSKEAEKFILDSIKKPLPMSEPEPKPKPKKSMSFDEALEYIRTTGKPGSYRKFLNGIKNKFGITLKYDNHGDDYAEPTLYFMKGKKECSREEMEKVKQYVIDTAEKFKSMSSQRKVEPMKLANGKTINLDLGVNN